MGVPGIYIAFRFGAKLTIQGQPTKLNFVVFALRQNLNKFQKPYFLVTVLVTLQQQSSPPPRLVKIWTGEFMRENLLSISKFVCRQTACRQLKPFIYTSQFYMVIFPCSCTTAIKKIQLPSSFIYFFSKLNCLFYI